MSYQYTYPDDVSHLDRLPAGSRELGLQCLAVARATGEDLLTVLMQAWARAEDKAPLAEIWGGPGAGAEFKR